MGSGRHHKTEINQPGQERSHPGSLHETANPDQFDQLRLSGNVSQLNLSPEQLTAVSKLPQTARLETVLFDIADASLRRRSKITGEAVNNDAIYRELNRIMVLNGYKKANLDGKTHISDYNLPKSWNSVYSHQIFHLYGNPPGNREAPHSGNGEHKQDKPDTHGRTDKPPVYGKPPEQPGKTPENPKSSPQADKPVIDLKAIAAFLEAQHNAAAKELQNEENKQHVIGKLVDGAKNYFGSSAEGRAWYNPKAIWSHFLNWDQGSSAIENKLKLEANKIEQIKLAAAQGNIEQFKLIYKELTGADFDPAKANGSLKLLAAIKDYGSSQRAGIDALTDVAAAAGTAFSLRLGKPGVSLWKVCGGAALTGGLTKSGLMRLESGYADFKRDFGMGAIWGLSTVLGERAGSETSRFLGKKYGYTVTGDLFTARIETQGVGMGLNGMRTRLLSAAAKSGVSGLVFGTIENPSATAIQNIEDGKSVSAANLVEKTIQGASLGFLGGTFLGFMFDTAADGFKSLRPSPVVRPKPGTINGVPVPPSGAVSMDDAAKMMGTTPADFAAKAKADPFAAVQDAANLYEKSGINIKKVDPLTGKSLLPEGFADALTSVQNVDGLTADTGLPIARKVSAVKASDAYLKENAQAVDASLSRLQADPNYQAVVRIKTEQSGAQSAQQFENSFKTGFKTDLKTGMAVDQVRNGQMSPADAMAQNMPITEAAYLQKAADFFKDMTDPAQRERLNVLVDDIYAKFNPELISRQDIQSMIEALPEADRKLATALLIESSGNASDVALKTRLQAVRSDIQAASGESSLNRVYTLAPDSSGNFLGYLYRKSNSFIMTMRNIDQLGKEISEGNIPHKIFLFDDLSSTPISQQQRDLLKKIPDVYVIDVGAFEKGINVLDLSRGPQAVAEKLDKLLQEARQYAAANPQILPSGIAKKVLSGSVDSAATALGPNVKVIRPTGNFNVPNMPSSAALEQMSLSDMLYYRLNVPKASKQEIASFLSQYAGEEREMAAKMLAEGAVHNSFPAMVAKAAQVHNQLVQTLQKSGLTSKDLLLVSDKDPGGSTHLISYLYGKINGLSSNNFTSSRGLDKLITGGGAKGKAIAYFDDTIYSGMQTAGMLNSNVSAFMPFKKVIVGSLGAYEQGINNINGTHLASIGKVDVATASVHQPFYSSNNPFYAGLSPDGQSIAKKVGGDYGGFGNVQGSLIWSYMYPDNNLNFFGPKFAGSVLRLPGP